MNIEISDSKEDVSREMKNFDTILTDDVWEWITVLLKYYVAGIPVNVVVAVCRYDNWKKIKEKNGNTKIL